MAAPTEYAACEGGHCLDSSMARRSQSMSTGAGPGGGSAGGDDGGGPAVWRGGYEPALAGPDGCPAVGMGWPGRSGPDGSLAGPGSVPPAPGWLAGPGS